MGKINVWLVSKGNLKSSALLHPPRSWLNWASVVSECALVRQQWGRVEWRRVSWEASPESRAKSTIQWDPEQKHKQQKPLDCERVLGPPHYRSETPMSTSMGAIYWCWLPPGMKKSSVWNLIWVTSHIFVPGPVLCLLICGPTDSSLCELSESSGCVDGLCWTHLCVPEAFHSGTVGNWYIPHPPKPS